MREFHTGCRENLLNVLSAVANAKYKRPPLTPSLFVVVEVVAKSGAINSFWPLLSVEGCCLTRVADSRFLKFLLVISMLNLSDSYSCVEWYPGMTTTVTFKKAVQW
jgi:hypothetical protein